MTTILEIVRAGAGSGKTTDLCNTVATAVAAGLDPARILATTFTKKAAAELKGRIQAKLLHEVGHKSADRLELAAISTVHSVAHHLLRRYAVDLGLSPRLEVFEQGCEKVLSNLLARLPSSRWDPLAEHADRLGVTNLPGHILGLLAAKRGNRINDSAFREHLNASTARVCELLAPSGPLPAASPPSLLLDLAREALAAIDAIRNDQTKATGDAKTKLRSLLSVKGSFWGIYLDAAKISAGKKSGADQKLDPLRLHAAEVRRNPRLHSDLREFSRLVAEETLALETLYDEYKAERGLVDFTDLETLLLGLLERNELTVRLSQDYDLVLVDEFQDTNPLQLAIFQRLRMLVPRNRWVGDSRQAIYGFRDTDPRLVEDTWNRVPLECRSTLPNNHRSQKGLVQLVGELFKPHFDEDPRQVPQKPSAPKGVERWIIDSSNNQDDATSMGCGIAQLRDEGFRFGDIAVLERGNAQLKVLASELDRLGIPYLIESPGLFSTREGQLLLAGLRLVADRTDSLAAATVLHLSTDPSIPTPPWLSDRLRECRHGASGDGADAPKFSMPWNGESLLSPLEHIDFQSLSPSLIVQQVIEAMALPKRVHSWGNSEIRCSNLDSAVRHARKYEEGANSGSGSATLSGLIVNFERLAANEEDLRFTSQGHDAVTLMTYHGAKGLEWPVVVLSGLNSERDPNLWKPVVSGSSDDDDPLSRRSLRNWTWPFGTSDGPFARIKSGSNLEADALASPEGLQQQRRESDENMRLLYVGCTRAKQKLVFAHRRGKYRWLESLSVVDTLLSPDLPPGEHPITGIDTTFVVRHLNRDGIAIHQSLPSARQSWFAAVGTAKTVTGRPRFHSPSQTECSDADITSFAATPLPGEQFFPAKSDEAENAAIGNALHGYFAALPSLRDAPDHLRTSVAERCIAAYGVTGIVPASVLTLAGQRFCDWVNTNIPGARWHVEVPASGPRANSGQWVGTIDLVLETPDGDLIVIDHKSAPIRREDCMKKASQFVGQLDAYSEILSGTRATIGGQWIHFPLAGVIVRCR